MSARIRALKAKKADAHKQASALLDKAAAEGRDLTAEEQTAFDGYKADMLAADKSIEREEFIANQAAGLGGVEIPAQASIRVEDNGEEDGQRGWATFGQFAKAVVEARMKGRVDQRLGIGAAAPSTVSQESVGADGGFAIPPDFSSEIWRMSLGEGSLLPMTSEVEITGNSMVFPKDESTPWGSTGVQAYWQAEATAGSQTKPVLQSQLMQLHKLMALVPVSNELMDDGFALGSYVQPLIADRITWKVNEAILFGDGVGKPLGAISGPAAVVQAKESGQAANTVVPANITKMVQRLLVGQLGNAVWIATPDILAALEAMTVGQYPVYLPGQVMSNAPYGLLKGRPLLLSEHAAALSSQSDISLVALKGYRTITKAGGLRTDTSMHLYFDADATALRVTFRMNGQPILSGPITPPKSSQTRTHFVTLASR